MSSRPDRNRRNGRNGGRERPGERRRDRERDRDRDRDRPRPPVKGRRRTFDTDSAPNERERDRDRTGGDDRGAGQWVDEGPVRRAAGDAVARGGSGGGRNRARKEQGAAKRATEALEIDRKRLAHRLGPAKAERSIQRLGEASLAFSEDRLDDAARLLKPLVDAMPDEPAVRELHGLTLYRLGRWRKAITELDEFVRRTGSVEQHPVLADCHRALGHHRKVAELWEELGEASPDAALVAEGRIVYAGSQADQGNLPAAIATLEQAPLGKKKLDEHHLRMRYALADLYDRAGEQQSARRHFQAIADRDPRFFDVEERLRQL